MDKLAVIKKRFESSGVGYCLPRHVVHWLIAEVEKLRKGLKDLVEVAGLHPDEDEEAGGAFDRAVDLLPEEE